MLYINVIQVTIDSCILGRLRYCIGIVIDSYYRLSRL